MIYTACPHCRLTLQVAREHQGRAMSCPRCSGGFIAPVAAPPVVGVAEPNAADNDVQIHPAVSWLLIGAGHLVGLIVLSIPLSFCGAFAVLLVVAAIEITIWQWKTLVATAESLLAHLPRPKADADDNPIVMSEVVTDRPPLPILPTTPSKGDVLHIPDETQHSSAAASLAQGSRDSKPPARESAAATRVPATRSEAIPPPQKSPQTLKGESQSVGSRHAPQASRKPAAPSWWPLDAFVSSNKPLIRQGAKLPAGNVHFFGAGTVLDLGRGVLESPFVYATPNPCLGNFDASLIDGSLDVAPTGSKPNERLSYWPSYFDATPAQRSCYLDWLIRGRCDPEIEIGYVFLYFYGLERRILVDRADHVAVAREVLRLRSIYSDCRSFNRYSAALLWLTVAIVERSSATAEIVDQLVASTDRWDEDLMACYLAYQHQSGKRLSAESAFLVAKADSRCPTSVVVRRHEKLFRELFGRRYASRFGEGIELRAGKRSKPLHYRPASGTLLSWISEDATKALTAIPDVLAITSQLKPLVEIWQQCVDELRVYDKAHRASGGDLTVDAFESLPPELRSGEHPQFDDWLELWKECSDDSGIPLVPINRLAKLRGIAERGTLLKSQCEKIVGTASCLGIGIEPDCRLTGKSYRWDDEVVLFFSEDGREEDKGRYQAAATLMQLGMYVAAADGEIDEGEAGHVLRHLESEFELTPHEVRRIECLRHRLIKRPLTDKDVTAVLRRQLSDQNRQLVGEYLVGVAVSDQVITPAEHKALRKLYDRLGLDESHLDRVLAPLIPVQPTAAGTAAPTPAASGFHLDLSAISRIMTETRAVAAILQEAMAEQEDSEDESDLLPKSDSTASSPTSRFGAESPSAVALLTTPVAAQLDTTNVMDARFNSLEPRYRPFLTALLKQENWSLGDAKALARDHKVMLSGAIEAVNEWSCECCGDWLIEDGDPLVVRRSLIAESA